MNIEKRKSFCGSFTTSYVISPRNIWAQCQKLFLFSISSQLIGDSIELKKYTRHYTTEFTMWLGTENIWLTLKHFSYAFEEIFKITRARFLWWILAGNGRNPGDVFLASTEEFFFVFFKGFFVLSLRWKKEKWGSLYECVNRLRLSYKWDFVLLLQKYTKNIYQIVKLLTWNRILVFCVLCLHTVLGELFY